MKKLGLEIPEYSSDLDPTRNADMTSSEMDWTIPTSQVKELKILYKKVCKPMKRKRKTYMYERDRDDFEKKPKISSRQLQRVNIKKESGESAASNFKPVEPKKEVVEDREEETTSSTNAIDTASPNFKIET